MIMMVVIMIKARRRGLARAGKAIGSCSAWKSKSIIRFGWVVELCGLGC